MREASVLLVCRVGATERLEHQQMILNQFKDSYCKGGYGRGSHALQFLLNTFQPEAFASPKICWFSQHNESSHQNTPPTLLPNTNTIRANSPPILTPQFKTRFYLLVFGSSCHQNKSEIKFQWSDPSFKNHHHSDLAECFLLTVPLASAGSGSRAKGNCIDSGGDPVLRPYPPWSRR